MTPDETTAAAPIKAISADALPSMFQAIAGLRNFRSAAAMLLCFGLSVIVPGLLWVLLGKGVMGAALGALVSMFLISSGIHAGGLLLMDQARQAPMRSLADALVLGMWCVPKSILLAVGLGLVVVVTYLVMALLFFICRLPGLGPLLYAVVFPLSVVVTGLTFTGLFIGMMIALAALWDDATVAGALVKAMAVLRTRLVETVLMSFVVLMLAGFVFFFVGGVLMTGFLPAVGMSATILGAVPSMFGSSSASMMAMTGGGYLLAGSFGSGLLFALTMTLVFQVWLLGINLLYLKVTEGLDTSATQASLQSGLAEARRKATDMGSKARQAAEQARAQAAQAMQRSRTPSEGAAAAVVEGDQTASDHNPAQGTFADMGPPSKAVLFCQACKEEVLPDDVFCSACGHRVQS